jgi:succinate dehydrogenase / fumarate reductase cytochrome b subunit
MKWFLDLFSSSLGRKVLMALTGLFLILFLAVHLAGNLQLLKHDDGQAFNVYAKFMTTNPVIKDLLCKLCIYHFAYPHGGSIVQKK